MSTTVPRYDVDTCVAFIGATGPCRLSPGHVGDHCFTAAPVKPGVDPYALAGEIKTLIAGATDCLTNDGNVLHWGRHPQACTKQELEVICIRVMKHIIKK